MQQTIFKICTRDQWDEAVGNGVYAGAAVDLADGFIHFSAAHQVAQTAARHFAGQDDLVLVSVAAALLGDQLKWEQSRGGDLFPHLYGNFSIDAVLRVDPLPVDDDGKHIFPLGFQC